MHEDLIHIKVRTSSYYQQGMASSDSPIVEGSICSHSVYRRLLLVVYFVMMLFYVFRIRYPIRLAGSLKKLS